MTMKAMLSPGEKIKQIRKDFKLNQSDIVGTEVTRNLISAIENGKASLTPKVAEIITKNINQLCKDNNINFHLTTSYLLEDIDEQEEKKANEYINYLKCNNDIESDALDKLVREIQVFLVNSNLYEKKLIIYEILGDIFHSKRQFEKSYTFYIRAFENSSRGDNKAIVSNLLVKLSNCCIDLGKISEALEFNDLALIYEDVLSPTEKYNIIFNSALVYRNLNVADKALKELNYIEENSLELDIKNLIKLKMLKANCLVQKKYYTEAIVIYKDVISKINKKDPEDMDLLLLSYSNLLNVYNSLNDVKNIKLYMNYTIKLLTYVSTKYNPWSLLQVSYGFKILGDTASYEEYLLKTIDVSKQEKDSSVLYKAVEALIDLYIHDTNIEKLNFSKNMVLELISLEILPKHNDLVLKLIKYYLTIDDMDNLKSIIYFLT